MIKNKKLFWGAFGVIALGSYLVYRFYSKTKSGQDLTYAESVKEDVNTATKTVVDKVLPVASYPLKVGSKGSNVLVLQKWLNDNGYASPKLVTDGSFGAKTESAVKQMQEYANDKRIIDYNLWSSDYKNGQITQDFYQIFVIKTKAVPSKGASGIDFNLGLGF
jgi:hypothetical protein